MQQPVTNKPSSSSSWGVGGILLFIVGCLVGVSLLLVAARPDIGERIVQRAEENWTHVTGADLGSRVDSAGNSLSEDIPAAGDYERVIDQTRSYLIDNERLPYIAGGLGIVVLFLIGAGVALNRRSDRASEQQPGQMGTLGPSFTETAARRPAEHTGPPPLVEGRQIDIAKKLEQFRFMSETRLIPDEQGPSQVGPATAPPPPAAAPGEPGTHQLAKPTLRPIQPDHAHQHSID